MLLMTLIYSPFEVLWPAYPKQSIFRNEWLLDVGYFLSTHLPIQITSFLILLPATQLTTFFGVPAVLEAMGRLPWLVQFFLAIFVADLAEYAIHRAFHTVPFLWRFHAIHHSSKALDWLAGSRSHLVDDVRGARLHPGADDVRLPARHHRRLPVLRHAARDLDPLQLQAEHRDGWSLS